MSRQLWSCRCLVFIQWAGLSNNSGPRGHISLQRELQPGHSRQFYQLGSAVGKSRRVRGSKGCGCSQQQWGFVGCSRSPLLQGMKSHREEASWCHTDKPPNKPQGNITPHLLSKRQEITTINKLVRKENPCALLGGMWMGTVTMVNGTEGCWNVFCAFLWGHPGFLCSKRLLLFLHCNLELSLSQYHHFVVVYSLFSLLWGEKMSFGTS